MPYIGNQPLTAAFVTDQFNGTGSTTAYTMSVAPANTSSMLVVISGVIQDPSAYAINGMTLTFSAAPPVGVGNISVRYLGIPASGIVNTAYRTVTELTATPSQTTFNVPGYTVGYINVYQNGVRLAPSDFTATSGTTVVLATGAISGDSLVTESFYVSSVLNAIPSIPGVIQQSHIGANVAGTGPAFSAYLSANQLITAGTWTKLQVNVEEFDTNSCYDNVTNYRFTPTVAGYYQVSGGIDATSSASYSSNAVSVFKNGTLLKRGSASNVGITQTISILVYLNGSTDYVELYGYVNGTTTRFSGGSDTGYFQASMVRSA